jgi:hypothetical protein
MPDSDEKTALDLAYELINQLHHCAPDNLWYKSQIAEPYKRLKAHPDWEDARRRHQQRFWDFLDQNAKEVAKWPKWMTDGARTRGGTNAR